MSVDPAGSRPSSGTYPGGNMRLPAEFRVGAERRRAMRCCVVTMTLATSIARGVSAQAPSAGGSAVGRQPASIRITAENVRFNNYLRELAGPRALVGVVGGGVFERLRQHDGTELGSLLAERATQHAAEVSVRHGLAAVMHRSTDYHYQFCDCHGLGPRVGHAIVQAFTDRRDDGSLAFSVAAVSWKKTGSFAGMAWEHDHSAGSVALGTTLSFGLSALFNIGRELSGIGRPH